MDYGYYGASQQPYQYMGMPANAYANTGVDLETMRSVVSALMRPCSSSLLPRPRSPPKTLADRVLAGTA